MNMRHETLFIREDLVDDINDLLAEKGTFFGLGIDDVIFMFSKRISDTDFEVNLKVVNGEQKAYIDAVLLERGNEVMCLEPQFEKIQGQYEFYVDDDMKIVLTVEPSEYIFFRTNT